MTIGKDKLNDDHMRVHKNKDDTLRQIIKKEKIKE